MQRCAICQIHTTTSLCEGCQSLIKAPENPCQVCAKPLSSKKNNACEVSFHSNGGKRETRHLICGECRSDPPSFSQTICAAIYEPPVSVWVQQLKFGDRLDRARIMAEALYEPIGAIDQTVPIIPMPLHRKRLLSRGYNQAFEVAQILTRKQHRPLLEHHLIRTKNTAMQAELYEKQRNANVRGAFAVDNPIDDSTVMVLDDVMTTGQTMRSVAKCLIQAGVQQVIAVVFARSGN